MKLAKLVISSLFVFPVFCQADGAGTPNIEIASPESDSTNYLSDRLKFSIDIDGIVVNTTKRPYSGRPACIPAFTTLKGKVKLRIDDAISPAFEVTNVPEIIGSPAENHCSPANSVKLGDIVAIDSSVISSFNPDRYGLTYGTLLVPYKYHLGGDKNFSSGTSLGGYIGFRQDKSGKTGLAMQYIGFLGASSIAVPTNADGQASTQNVTGVSYGFGIIGTVKSDFNIGLVLGWDRVGKSTTYANDGKMWIAISLGFDFSK